MNIKKVRPFMETAKVWAFESNCSKRKVGACIFNMSTCRILSTGYNGTISGMCNCSELFSVDELHIHTQLFKYIRQKDYTVTGWREVKWDKFCKLHKEFAEMYETHAEQNAIYNLLKSGVNCTDFSNIGICITLEPCIQCAKAIISLGISHVWYLEEHESSHSQVEKMFENARLVYEQY